MADYLLMTGSNENLERVYRASCGDVNDWDIIWLNDMRTMLARASQLTAKDPVRSCRVSKVASGMDMLIHLGGSRRKIQDIEKAVAVVKAVKAQKADVVKQVAEARIMTTDLIAHAEKFGALNDGVVDAKCSQRLDDQPYVHRTARQGREGSEQVAKEETINARNEQKRNASSDGNRWTGHGTEH
jgi:hypothetical protein